MPSASAADLTRWPATSKSPPCTLESIKSSSNSTIMVRGSATRAPVIDGGTESGVTVMAAPETASLSLCAKALSRTAPACIHSVGVPRATASLLCSPVSVMVTVGSSVDSTKAPDSGTEDSESRSDIFAVSTNVGGVASMGSSNVTRSIPVPSSSATDSTTGGSVSGVTMNVKPWACAYWNGQNCGTS